jgi:branched-chain amino acid transport system substrate-binding protein
VGHLCSGSTQPASDVYDDEGVLMITPAATNPAITERGLKLIFRTIGVDSQQGSVAGRYIAEKVKPQRLAIIHDKQQYGQGVADEVRKAVTAGGFKPVLYEGINKGQTDFSALVTKLKSQDVDFVYYGGYHPELGLLLRQARAQGFEARFMGPEGVGNRDITAIAGKASEGLLVTLPADFTKDPANAQLVKAFKAKQEDPSGPFVMPAYAAVQVIAEGIAKAGNDDPEAVAEALRKNAFDTPIGKIAFDAKGDLKQFRFVVFEWHADASKTPVE